MTNLLQHFMYAQRRTRLLWLSIAAVIVLVLFYWFKPAATVVVLYPANPFDSSSERLPARSLPTILLKERPQLRIDSFQARDDEVDIQLSGSFAAFIIWLTMLSETAWKPHQAEVLPQGASRLQLTMQLRPNPEALILQRDELQHAEAIASIAAQFEHLPEHRKQASSGPTPDQGNPILFNSECHPQTEDSQRQPPKQRIIWLPPS